MSTSDYRPSVVETLYREHKTLMAEAAECEKKQANPKPAHTGNRAERRRKAAQVRKDQTP